jgi:hypothetical protein
MSVEEIKEHLASINEEAILYDDLDEALVGIGHRYGIHGGIAVYDLDKVFICLEKVLGPDCTNEEVIEYFDYNVIGTYAGEYTPMFIETF